MTTTSDRKRWMIILWVLSQAWLGLAWTATTTGSSSWTLNACIAPEVSSTSLLQRTTLILDEIFGKEDSWDHRREEARATTLQKPSTLDGIPDHELVYGELGIEALATILDAVGVQKGDVFLDIGSGDGLLVMGAALLFPDYFAACRGIEIVPELYERSLGFWDRLKDNSSANNNNVSFHLGNIYEWDHPQPVVSTSTLAVCFATTWSKNIPGKRLDRLSKALGKDGGSTSMPSGARIVIIDGVLDATRDGYSYEGELRLHCPDTAPYSTARLYKRL